MFKKIASEVGILALVIVIPIGSLFISILGAMSGTVSASTEMILFYGLLVANPLLFLFLIYMAIKIVLTKDYARLLLYVIYIVIVLFFIFFELLYLNLSDNSLVFKHNYLIFNARIIIINFIYLNYCFIYLLFIFL